ncbi:MAG: hypothetical protein B9S32_14095 [Verrucomicrobia bacterium Tous-C9LFEB]|nr:MAG: hypothetical protein B9S32_14095 [Verrucomicrobia bacterium Tous-C9LFEB]
MTKRSIFTAEDGKNYTVTFILISSLFLLWGFCNGMIDVMDKHFQDQLHLTKSQSAWVQVAHYMGYCFMSLPAGWLARRLGYKGGLISGLLIVALGGFWFIPATQIASLWAFLLGVFILAMGLTFLETIANPYTTVLGDPHYAAARINLAQSCNGIGWILGPVVGGMFFYSSEGAEAASKTLYIPYLAVALIVLVMAAVFFFATIPEIQAEDAYTAETPVAGKPKSIWSHPHFVGAVIAQFCYVAAQAGIFSFFINYIVAEIPPVSEALASGWLLKGGAILRDGAYFVDEKGATVLLGYIGFTLFLLGRFSGSILLRKVPAHTILGLYGLINAALMLVIFAKIGWLSVAALFLSFYFMSIMFPTIFALGIFGLGEQSKKASSFIVMAIMGGAVMPKLMGWVGDHYNMSRGFIVPFFCFAYVAFYSFGWPKLSQATPRPVGSRH